MRLKKRLPVTRRAFYGTCHTAHYPEEKSYSASETRKSSKMKGKMKRMRRNFSRPLNSCQGPTLTDVSLVLNCGGQWEAFCGCLLQPLSFKLRQKTPKNIKLFKDNFCDIFLVIRTFRLYWSQLSPCDLKCFIFNYSPITYKKNSGSHFIVLFMFLAKLPLFLRRNVAPEKTFLRSQSATR